MDGVQEWRFDSFAEVEHLYAERALLEVEDSVNVLLLVRNRGPVNAMILLKNLAQDVSL